MSFAYDKFVGWFHNYDNNKYWLGVESDDKDAYGIVSDETYRHDYPSNINKFLTAEGVALFKPKKLIPLSSCMDASQISTYDMAKTHIVDLLSYNSTTKRECDRFDNLVRGFDGRPFPGAIYKMQNASAHVAILLEVKKNNHRGGWVYGYMFSTAFNGFTGKMFKAPYSEFDLSELKLFTDSGNTQPKFIGCLSIAGFNKYKLDFKNKINSVWLDIGMILSEHLDLSEINKEETSNGD